MAHVHTAKNTANIKNMLAATIIHNLQHSTNKIYASDFVSNRYNKLQLVIKLYLCHV